MPKGGKSYGGLRTSKGGKLQTSKGMGSSGKAGKGSGGAGSARKGSKSK